MGKKIDLEGFAIEYNTVLALRKFGSLEKESPACLPEKLEIEKSYKFWKRGYRVYSLGQEIPLVETDGEQRLSSPIATIEITETTQKILIGVLPQHMYTKGKYQVKKVL